MVSESLLYSFAAGFSFIAFLVSLKFLLDPLLGWSPKHTWDRLPYGTYPIVILGFLALARCFEYSEKAFFKNRVENDDIKDMENKLIKYM